MWFLPQKTSFPIGIVGWKLEYIKQCIPTLLPGCLRINWRLATIVAHLFVSFLRLLLSCASLIAYLYVSPVHSLVLSYHCFLCLPRFLFPSMIWARGLPLKRGTWPTYPTFRLTTFPRSSLVMFSSSRMLRFVLKRCISAKFSFCVIAQYCKIWETTFPKAYFNKHWLNVADYQ